VVSLDAEVVKIAMELLKDPAVVQSMLGGGLGF
jgi:hypothetical protein